MTENIIFLLLGSILGFLSSIGTMWIQHRLEIRRQRDERNYMMRDKMIADARKFLQEETQDRHEPGRSRDLHILRYGSPGRIELCRFLIEAGPDQGTTISIFKNVHVIGQSRDLCDHILSDTSISDAHLRLIVTDEVIVLEDISGGLGTRIGDRLMTRPITIKDGDLIGLGNSRLRFQIS